MKIERFDVAGPLLFKPDVYEDPRGYFLERWRQDAHGAAGLDATFVQDNLSRSRRGVLRGLHFQREPHAQGKLVSVVRGRILDVIVDLRQGSPTYLRHLKLVLDDENHFQLWVPKGFAHGFLALSESDVLYKVDHRHAPESDSGLRWNDPDLGIDWGLDSLGPGDWPMTSAKDAALPFVAQGVPEFAYR